MQDYCKSKEERIEIRAFKIEDISACIELWNFVVEEGCAFPQMDILDEKAGMDFFTSQTFTGVAEIVESGEIVGLYILHPNNVGRCSHICNASFAVKKEKRNLHIGERLVRDCIKRGKYFGFRILQFNAVVANNASALALYKKIGFVRLGRIPKGFLLKDGSYEDIIPHYIEL